MDFFYAVSTSECVKTVLDLHPIVFNVNYNAESTMDLKFVMWGEKKN